MRSLAEKRQWESPFRVGAVPRGAQAVVGAGDVRVDTGRAAAGDSGSSPTVALPSVGKPLASLSHQLPPGPGPEGPRQRLSDRFWLQSTVSRALDTQPSPFYMSCTHAF